jgi:hypothetical protein
MAPTTTARKGHLNVDPRRLFPVLAIAFAVVAAIRFMHERQFGPAVRTWVMLAAVFAAVSAWMHSMS